MAHSQTHATFLVRTTPSVDSPVADCARRPSTPTIFDLFKGMRLHGLWFGNPKVHVSGKEARNQQVGNARCGRPLKFSAREGANEEW